MFNSNAKKELAALTEYNQQLNTELLTLREENANYKRTISAFVGVKSGFEAELDKSKKAFKQQVEELTKTVEVERASVAKKVNKALADIGVKEFAAEEITNSDTSGKSIYNTFTSLNGAEKTEYFKKNEAALSKMLGFSKI